MMGNTRRLAGGLLALLASSPALADWQLNMTRGVTEVSREVYDLHMLILGICTVIGVVVFGAIFWTILRHRKSKGVTPAKFHHSTTVEIVWTVIPMAILIAMAVPATTTLIEIYDTSEADMTVKVTGFQWKWQYEYLDSGLRFYSTIDRDSNLARQRAPIIKPQEVEHYMRNVDRELVLPVGKKVRFLITSNDVIHSWWVPDFGWKQDAIPGYINENWVRIDEPGVYRGQCAELCGRDHAFMPVVVRAVSQDEFDQWIAEQGGSAPTESEAEPVAVAAATSESETEVAAEEPAPAETAEAETEAEAEAEPEAESLESMDALVAKGEQVYAQACASCHQPNGQGLPPTFPALAGSAIATGPVEAHIDIVLNGKPGTAMVAFGGTLSDEDIAAVVTYERNAWGNDTGDVVTAADVAAAR